MTISTVSEFTHGSNQSNIGRIQSQNDDKIIQKNDQKNDIQFEIINSVAWIQAERLGETVNVVL